MKERRYQNICEAIIRRACEDEIDFRDLMRQWIQLFENTRVVGFSRDEFLDEMVLCKAVGPICGFSYCHNCNKLFLEEDLDIVNGNWLCRLCEEEFNKD